MEKQTRKLSKRNSRNVGTYESFYPNNKNDDIDYFINNYYYDYHYHSYYYHYDYYYDGYYYHYNYYYDNVHDNYYHKCSNHRNGNCVSNLDFIRFNSNGRDKGRGTREAN